MKTKLPKPLQIKNAHYQEKELLNKKSLLTAFQRKAFLILLITSLFPFSGIAQVNQSDKATAVANQNPEEKTGVELYLRRTELSIYSDQKHLLANHLNQDNADLSNATILQEYAMKLYESGKEKEALICSSKAREIAMKLLASFKGNDYASHYDNFKGEEAQLAEIKKDTSTAEQWLAKTKQ